MRLKRMRSAWRQRLLSNWSRRRSYSRPTSWVTHDAGDRSAALSRVKRECCSAVHSNMLMRWLRPEVAVELVIGDTFPRSTGKILWLSVDSHTAVIARERREGHKAREEARVHPAALFVAASYAAAAVTRAVVGDGMPLPRRERIVLDLDALGISEAVAKRSVDLGQAYLAGAGAIGTSFLWVLRWFAGAERSTSWISTGSSLAISTGSCGRGSRYRPSQGRAAGRAGAGIIPRTGPEAAGCAVTGPAGQTWRAAMAPAAYRRRG
jgi:hypothetical protein